MAKLHGHRSGKSNSHGAVWGLTMSIRLQLKSKPGLGIYAVIIDGRNAQYNNGWTGTSDYNEGMVANGAGIIVEGATLNVSIEYAWVPNPTPVSKLTPSKSSAPPGISIGGYHVLYIVVAAILIVAAATTTVLMLRRRE